MGNISAIYEDDELVCRYEYDSLNRLIREDNKAMDMSVLFAYDKSGNITGRRLYAYIPNKATAELENEQYVAKLPYFYEGDKLLSYCGKAFAYDLAGNPTKYKSVNCVWERGRYLKKYGSITFAYDGFGRRTQAGNRHFTYDVNDRLLFDGTFLYLYDHTGLLGFVDNRGESSVTYFYEKDAQGNIRAILDSTGALVVKYVYDACGQHLVLDARGATVSDATHIGNLNPFRYRSYMYDVETGLYYLQSRYYDPEIGRFLNADTVEYLDPESINGLNLYAYCGNNPVMYSDPSGHFVITTAMILGAIKLMTIGFAIGSVISGGFEIAKQINSNGLEISQWDWAQIGKAALGGGVAGAIAAIPIPGFKTLGLGGKILSYTLSFVAGGVGSALGGLISGSVGDGSSFVIAFVLGGGQIF